MYNFSDIYIIVSLMNTSLSYPDKIRTLLQSNTVMSLKQLRLELGHRPRSSLFRDLKKLELVTSYTHAGQYHALRSAARFDAHGLWFFDQVGFATYGTLKNTLLQLISTAPAGMTQQELKSLLRIPVQNTLTALVKSNQVGRYGVPNQVYVYLSVAPPQAEAQQQRRWALLDTGAAMSLPAEHLIIELLLELIRIPDGRADAQELAQRLRKRGIAIAEDAIVYVLAYYDLKKKPILNSSSSFAD